MAVVVPTVIIGIECSKCTPLKADSDFGARSFLASVITDQQQ
uniref:Uncharacterized protein n=1 Tax=Moniliophthora roreri TaxID=221103 RepID=A0A0W0GDJ0_MONRR